MKNLIEIALTYPYVAPSYSYLYHQGQICPMIGNWGRVLHGRHPVIAYGSNRAPRQLWRKFGESETIPVTRARLTGFEIVYSAHFAGYGAMPATLIPSAGTICEVFLVWLTDAQLLRMHESEARGIHYEYAQFVFPQAEGAEVITATAFEFGPESSLICQVKGAIAQAGCYYSLKGCYISKDQPIALAGISGRKRILPQKTQTEILHFVRDQIAEDMTLTSFIETVIQNEVFRKQATENLQAQSRHYMKASGGDVSPA